MEENDRKAWVRFRYPRWMYDGPAICGIPVEASRGFLRGWYAQNGVSLENPRLGYVCVSEDLTGQFGLCGYFQEYDYDLAPEERLRFAPDESPPPFDPDKQPRPPEEHWNEDRLAKAARNYALEYCRNGIRELIGVIGRERTLELGKRSARLTGLQQYPHIAEAIGAHDGGIADAAQFLAAAFAGMGDQVDLSVPEGGESASLDHHGLRIVRDMEGVERATLLSCWIELWRGAIASHRQIMDVHVEDRGQSLNWTLSIVGR